MRAIERIREEAVAIYAAIRTLLGRPPPAERPPVVAFVNGLGESIDKRYPRRVPSRHRDGQWN